MEKQYINYWEFESLIIKAAYSYIDKYKLRFADVNSNSINLSNDKICISISDKLGDFSIGISNGSAYLTIGELIFKKFPNYIELVKKNADNVVYKLQMNDFDQYDEYFIYLVKTSFDFIAENSPKVFEGIFD